MNRDGIYPDDDDNRIACLEAEGRIDRLLEYADEALMGKMEQDGDPPDGIVVEVVLGATHVAGCDGRRGIPVYVKTPDFGTVGVLCAGCLS